MDCSCGQEMDKVDLGVAEAYECEQCGNFVLETYQIAGSFKGFSKADKAEQLRDHLIDHHLESNLQAARFERMMSARRANHFGPIV